MRKGLVTILAVAIIGMLGIYSKEPPAAKSSQPVSSVTSNTPDSNTNSNSSLASTLNSKKSAPGFKDGVYSGDTEDTVYGPVQISIVIRGGKIIDVNFLVMPDDRGHTQEVTAFSEPLLKNSTIAKQSADIDFVSGATQTCEGYRLSLQSALDQAA